MSRQRTLYRSWGEEKTHREKVIAKLETVQGLQALLAEWESKSVDGAFSDEDYQYILHLRERVRQARNQYFAMKP